MGQWYKKNKKQFLKSIKGRKPTGRPDARAKEVTEPFKLIKALWQQVTDAELCSPRTQKAKRLLACQLLEKKKSSPQKMLSGSKTAC